MNWSELVGVLSALAIHHLPSEAVVDVLQDLFICRTCQLEDYRGGVSRYADVVNHNMFNIPAISLVALKWSGSSLRLILFLPDHILIRWQFALHHQFWWVLMTVCLCVCLLTLHSVISIYIPATLCTSDRMPLYTVLVSVAMASSKILLTWKIQ